MEDNISTVNNHHSLTATNKRRHGGAFTFAAGEEAFAGGGGGEANVKREDQNDDSFEEGGRGDSEVWNAFESNFQEVQTVLDRNRVLIQQVNDNHQSKIHENLVENVNLIQEINGNISKVVALYTDLSTNFSSSFNQRKAATEYHSNPDKADR